MRLPSMVIRRDILGHSPPTAQQFAQWAAMGAKLQHLQAHTPIPPTIAPQGSTLPPSGLETYPQPSQKLDNLEQKDVMKREAWERERLQILKKASNFGGESAERVISEYLAL